MARRGPGGQGEVGPVGGSTHRRLLLERLLSSLEEGEGDHRPRLEHAGVSRVERAPVVVDGQEVAVLEVFLFAPDAATDLDAVLDVLANALGLVMLRERQERQVRDQLRMIGNLAHELRSPLTTVVGFADLLETSWPILDDADRVRAVEVIGRQARRMLRLSSEALAVSRDGEHAAMGLQLQPIDLGAAVKVAASDLLHPEIITLRCEQGLEVMADADRLQQILLNLLANALVHGTPPIEVSAHRAGGSLVEVVVSDRGLGVSPTVVPRLFEPFDRGDKGASGDHAGLGLSIVRDLARSHGGDISYEPNWPTGAKLILSLPAS